MYCYWINLKKKSLEKKKFFRNCEV